MEEISINQLCQQCEKAKALWRDWKVHPTDKIKGMGIKTCGKCHRLNCIIHKSHNLSEIIDHDMKRKMDAPQRLSLSADKERIHFPYQYCVEIDAGDEE